MRLFAIEGGGANQQKVAADMAEEIKAVVYKYSERISLAGAIGVLEIVKTEIFDDHRNRP